MRIASLAIVGSLSSALLLLASAGCSRRGEAPPTPARDGGARDAGPDAGGCVDGDGDGFGAMCTEGPDCDDTNPTQTGREVCDGADNDCDGEADEGVRSACGDCDARCRPLGFPGPSGFDPSADPSEGVSVDPTGALVLAPQTFPSFHLIWIANTAEGTVSKVDTRTFEELARYRTGPAGAANDPSRTSVGISGDVYVANRGHMSVTRISALGDACPDTNGDGVITTSRGGDDVLPWGDDDCVLWHTRLPGGLTRAVAAHVERGPDGELVESLWVGIFDAQRLAKLDAATGATLFQARLPGSPYGFAFDGRDNLWVALTEGALGRVDVSRCVDAASCEVAVCPEGSGDGCVQQVIPVPGGVYGITVDARQRVWLGGGASPTRYDPMAPAGRRFLASSAPYFAHGIAADARGNVWGASLDSGLVRIDADDPSRFAVVPVTIGLSSKGVAVDDDGKVWAINQLSDDATVVVPGPEIDAFTVWTTVVPTLVQPYTYSDMTGQQLRLATSLTGFYRRVIEACPGAPEGPTRWGALRFDAEVPTGASLLIRVRTADTRDALMAQPWVRVAEVPDDVSPADIGAALMGAGVTPGALLEVSLELGAWRARGTAATTPRVRDVEVQVSKQCDVIG
jgi:DNA-binding beta-propeller fold protein YncE